MTRRTIFSITLYVTTIVYLSIMENIKTIFETLLNLAKGQKNMTKAQLKFLEIFESATEDQIKILEKFKSATEDQTPSNKIK